MIGSTPETRTGTPCRLCMGETSYRFDKVVLGRYRVGYFSCSRCASLQTEAPYWLDQAYAAKAGGQYAHLNFLDTGAAHRNLVNVAAVVSVAKSLSLRNLVDHGGGDGLLCRLLRDYGFNSFVNDRYGSLDYARGFDRPNFDVPDLVTAFEVLEHFPNPAADLQDIFRSKPKAVLITTELFNGQDENWWYLIPETGHHVYFYSSQAFLIISERFGYDLLRVGSYTLFVREGFMKFYHRLQLKIALRNTVLKVRRALLSFRNPHGAERDFCAGSCSLSNQPPHREAVTLAELNDL